MKPGIIRNVEDVPSKSAKSANLLPVEPSGDGASRKLTFDILMRKDGDPEQLSAEVSSLEEISEVVLVASKSDVDY